MEHIPLPDKRMKIRSLDKFARNVHNPKTNNERSIISTFPSVVAGHKVMTAILEHDDGREEWMECQPDDARRGVIIDGKTYRFIKPLNRIL